MDQQTPEGIVKFGVYLRRPKNGWIFQPEGKGTKSCPVFRVPSSMKSQTKGYAMSFEEYAVFLPNIVEHVKPPEETQGTIGSFFPSNVDLLRAFRWTVTINEFETDLFRAIHCRNYRIVFAYDAVKKRVSCSFETEFILTTKKDQESILERVHRELICFKNLHARVVHYQGQGRKIDESIITMQLRQAEIVGNYDSSDVLALKMQCDVLSIKGQALPCDVQAAAPVQTPIKKALKPPIKATSSRGRSKKR